MLIHGTICAACSSHHIRHFDKVKSRSPNFRQWHRGITVAEVVSVASQGFAVCTTSGVCACEDVCWNIANVAAGSLKLNGGCSHQLKALKLSDCFAMGGSANSGCVTAPASEADHATMSLSFESARNESILESEKSGEGSIMSVEEQIEKSKSRWSLVADQSGCMEKGEECEAEVRNVQEFMALQRHPTFHSFTRFDYDTEICKRDGSLEVGEKFAKGGLAELFHVQVFWWHPEDNEYDLTHQVLKVFKKGTFLKHLKSTLPLGLLQFHAWEMKNLKFLTSSAIPRFQCEVHRRILLKDGKFVFFDLKRRN